MVVFPYALYITQRTESGIDVSKGTSPFSFSDSFFTTIGIICQEDLSCDIQHHRKIRFVLTFHFINYITSNENIIRFLNLTSCWWSDLSPFQNIISSFISIVLVKSGIVAGIIICFRLRI
jgi:hypothetical protein